MPKGFAFGEAPAWQAHDEVAAGGLRKGEQAVIGIGAIQHDHVSGLGRAPQLVAQDPRFALPRTQMQAQAEVVAQVIQHAALRLHTVRPRVLIGLHRIFGARLRRVGQGQVRAIGRQQPMPAPAAHLLVGFIQLIETLP